MLQPESVPWYKVRTSPPPFSLAKKISSTRSLTDNPPASPFRTIAFFPWTHDSLQTLWNGHHDISPAEWTSMIDEFSDAVAVGSDHKMYVFFTRQANKNPLCYKLPKSDEDLKALPTDCVNVAWALNPHPMEPLEPLLLFSYLNLLHIYNIKRQGLAGYLRGHGSAITSIVVHPINANLFCTTSRDYTTRIYDLRLPPHQFPNNPCWPPGTSPSLAGAAHGLHMTEVEGKGIGRCIIVLMGGRSGGHQAAVLGAAFHPDFPIIATCGLDRLVKIWHVPRAFPEVLAREDKPLFSSSRIHKARVLSVTWLQPDLLLTHSAPAIMRNPPDNPDVRASYLEPGQLVVWRWLGLNRFFPPGREDVRQDVLRGCASDYQESNSFKIISAVSFPKVPTQFDVPMLHVYQSPSHDPIVLFTYPKSNVIRMFNVIHMQPRKPPPFPLEPGLVEQTQLRSDDESPLLPPRDIPPEIATWEITTGTKASADLESLTACAMGMDGTTIIGVGVKGSMWIWKARRLTLANN
ncbi:putative WD domain, G-beta repeat [Lyophyllum shimeji]|uniref:WD domain, G-beta repeat n=1 Tax=Lyophyllum shimeji TaxID=47721 RepID=A0A9P3PHC2_LYOSH|nr:putative WD domain, G-beta repeat [Lyophyllum shimeji]